MTIPSIVFLKLGSKLVANTSLLSEKKVASSPRTCAQRISVSKHELVLKFTFTKMYQMKENKVPFYILRARRGGLVVANLTAIQ